ncbi:hypothetical protein IWQ60_009796 [Tieghemiomyces parasiticus]|uniref:Uncharacterized protein n=1 Tax=Tieghemiomyces parasiticus TaxID=78921 RepID=A0A9W7ZSJ8_9FUNG|nr:hypothetical protein IWQ60_009796 [Tieghemiomyces parasiticus]
MPTSVRPTRQRGPESNSNDLASRFRSLALVSRAREDVSSGNPATATRIPPVEGKHNIDNIRSFTTQDAYFAYIQDQVQAYRATYGDQVLEATSPNSPHVTTQRAAADEIVGAIRKLREGVTAARRQDETAARIYEASVEMCIRAGHDSELLKSFGPLLDDLYPHFASARDGIPSPATIEATGRPAPSPVAALQRRSEMTAYYYLFLLSQYARRTLSNDIHQAATDRNVSTELDRQAQQYYNDYRTVLGAIKSGTKELDRYQSFTLRDPVKPNTLSSPEKPTLKVWFKKKPIPKRPM